jgi:hypothetical protein
VVAAPDAARGEAVRIAAGHAVGVGVGVALVAPQQEGPLPDAVGLVGEHPTDGAILEHVVVHAGCSPATTLRSRATMDEAGLSANPAQVAVRSG